MILHPRIAEATARPNSRSSRGLARWRLLAALGLLLAVAAIILALALGGQAPVIPPVSSPSTGPTPIPIDQALLNRRVTFLLLGTDQNAARQSRGESVLTDSMIVVSINAAHTRLSMISVPRDTVDVPLPDGSTWHEKLNELYTKQGMGVTRGTFDRLLGAKIDYVVELNMDDFTDVIDAFGGIDLIVPEAIVDPSIALNIKAGRQHLDGKTALLYSRSRHTTNDFSRAARQQLMLRALLARFDDPAVKVDVLSLVSSLPSLKTDIPRDKLPTLAEIARRSRNAAVTGKVLQPPDFYQVSIDPVRGYILLPDLEAIRKYSQPLLTGS
jgi:LCP family protein required for cell wall assembly